MAVFRDSNMTAAQKAQMLNKPAQHITSGQPPHKRQKHDHRSTSLANSLPTPVHSHENKAASPEQLQLLLLLAEKYFAAAHAGHSWAGPEVSPQGLIATGLGCLEAVLKNFRLLPAMESAVRLKYALILHEETENVAQAEEALSKGITLCERHKFISLKYDMQHLLARVLFKLNPRASLKYLDGTIKDVEAYRHTASAYAFRFLRVFLSLELGTHIDTLSAVNHLKVISHKAQKNGDKAVHAMAETLEAMIHLRQSNRTENIEQAERALALARSHQGDPIFGFLPQLVTTMQFVDICCTQQKFDPAQSELKMKALQTTLPMLLKGASWKDDGSFSIPVSSPSTGVMQSMIDGQNIALRFNWLPREDISALACLLSGAAMFHRNATDGQKSEQILREGLRTLDKPAKATIAILPPRQLSESRDRWRRSLKCKLHLHLAFAFCARTAWPEAQHQLGCLEDAASTLPIEIFSTLEYQILYLSGVINQGTGNISAALSYYRKPSLSLPTSSQPALPPIHLEFCILSALNTLLIVHHPSHPSYHLLQPLLENLTPLCKKNSNNKALYAAYQLVSATCFPPTSILPVKQHLQFAVDAAKGCSNEQLLCMTLHVIWFKFFKGVVGEQAEKNARACGAQARRCLDSLWETVAAGVLANALDLVSKGKEAEQARRQGELLVSKLPPLIGWGQGDSMSSKRAQ